MAYGLSGRNPVMKPGTILCVRQTPLFQNLFKRLAYAIHCSNLVIYDLHRYIAVNTLSVNREA